VEDEITKFLARYGKSTTRQTQFSSLVQELKLGSSDQEDRLQLFSLMRKITAENTEIESKGEAGALLVEQFDLYYKKKYSKSLFL